MKHIKFDFVTYVIIINVIYEIGSGIIKIHDDVFLGKCNNNLYFIVIRHSAQKETDTENLTKAFLYWYSIFLGMISILLN